MLARITASRTTARRALAAYYRTHFGMTARAARLRSDAALDGMRRSYFVFHKPG